MSTSELFDPQKIESMEGEPTILGFFLYSATINENVSKYFSKSANDLDAMTGENFRLFFVETDEQRREETYEDIQFEEPERNSNFFTGMRNIEMPKIRRILRRNQYAVVALGEYFLEKEYWRMPCLVFFSRFDSREFYVYEVDHLPNEDIAKLIMKLASEAENVWGERAVPDSDEMRQRIRQQAYDQFIPTLRRVAVKDRLRKISKDAIILAILGSAIGLV